MTINRAFFFDHVRSTRFTGKLSKGQVDGLGFILDEWEAHHAAADDRWLAYALATAYHETAFTMQPVTEFGSDSYKIRMYSPHSAVPKRAAMARANGQRSNQDALDYCGKGYVQLTWRNNYIHMGTALGTPPGNALGTQPNLALQPDVAAKIMFYGMEHGSFTGKKFATYFTGTTQDWVNARRIINGLDCADKIAVYAKDFYAAISYTT